jgi:hypothetical protein
LLLLPVGEPCPVFGAVAPAVALINTPNELGDADPAAPTVTAIGPGIAGAENVPIAVPPAPPPPEDAPPMPPLVDPPLPPAPNTVTRTLLIDDGFVQVAGDVYVYAITEVVDVGGLELAVFCEVPSPNVIPFTLVIVDMLFSYKDHYIYPVVSIGLGLIDWSTGSYQNWSATTSAAQSTQNKGSATSNFCCST